MKATFKAASLLFLLLLICCCSSNDSEIIKPEVIIKNYKYLALGDSYTIGQSVCESCNFPSQLKDSIKQKVNIETNLKIIATTGWTTTDLKNAIIKETPLPDEYDLVTLLIGVNNQYQKKTFSIYESEFPELLDTAISLAKGNASHVIVVSIPDYAYTPFGENFINPNTSIEIDHYNNFAKMITCQKNAVFIDITDITRMGLQSPDLVASDGLHPSEKAYSKFVQRLLPEAIKILNK